MAVEAKRGCGFRKIGGIYLVASGAGLACDRLPMPLTVCPVCSCGIKQARGWTWVDVAGLVGGDHADCKDAFPCPICKATAEMGRAGLLWIGESFYKTPGEFQDEARDLGISRRIKAVPRGFALGATWVLLGHPKAVTCPTCHGSGVDSEKMREQMQAMRDSLKLDPAIPAVLYPEKSKVRCEACSKGKVPGIFRVFKPERIEKIVSESQSHNEEFMAKLADAGLTPVIVPDDDKDHMGSVFDKGDEDE